MVGHAGERSWLPAACGAAGVGAIVLFLYLALPLLGHPYGVQYEEGVVLDTVGRIVEAQPIYTDFTAAAEPRYVLDRYGPIYPYLTAYLYVPFGFGFFGGRVVTLVATLGSAALLALVLRRRGAGGVGLLAAAFFLASRDIISFGCLHRPETLGLFWGILSLALSFREDRLRYAAVGPAVLALWTTPLSLAGVVAAAVALLVRSRRDGAWFTGSVVGICAIGFIVAEVATDCFFARHVLLCGGFHYWFGDLWDRFGFAVIVRYGPALLVAGYGLVSAVRTGEWALAVFGVVAVFAGLRAGYETEDGGVLVEAVAGLAVLCALGLARAQRAQPVIGLGILQGVVLLATAGHEFFPLSLRSDMLRRDSSVMHLLSTEEGYVLSDNPGYPALRKEGLYLEPRTYRALVRQGRVDERDLLHRIENGDFKRAVLTYEMTDRGGDRTIRHTYPDRLSHVVESTIRERLPLQETFDIKCSPTRRLITEVRSAVPLEMPR